MKSLIYSWAIFLFVIPLVFNCCNNGEDSVTPPAQETIYLLTKITQGTDVKEELTFDSEYKLLKHVSYISVSEYTTATFRYNQSGLIGSKDVYSNIGGQPVYTSADFVYNTDRRLIKSINYEISGGVSKEVSYVMYVYGTDGILMKKEMYSSAGVLIQSCEHQCDGNTNVKKEFTSTPDNTGTLVVRMVNINDYDDKINPYRYCRIPDKCCPYINRNNIVKNENIIYTDQDPGGVSTITNMVYQYNEKGYPVSRTESGSTYQYEYIEVVR